MPSLLYWVVMSLQVFMFLLAVGILLEVRSKNAEVPLGSVDDLIGSPAPPFAADSVIDGRSTGSRDIPWSEYSLLFVSSHCNNCHSLATELGKVETGPIIAICSSKRAKCTKFVALLRSDAIVLSDPSAKLARLYLATSSPTLVVVANGTVKSHTRPTSASEVLQAIDGSRRRGNHDRDGVAG